MKYKKVIYNNMSFVVIDIEYKDISLPLILDWVDFKVIKKLNKKWKYNESGLISCHHVANSFPTEVFIHDIVMILINQESKQKSKKKPITHINTLGIDNRRQNIIYDITNKQINKNMKKKKRTIILPELSGINPNELPTYVWYLKPNKSHGERFMISVNDIKWKTTSSKKLSLRYKLEEAKKYLRELKKNNPSIFENNCMNGEYTKKGKDLLKSFYEIIYQAGYTHINPKTLDGITDSYLKENKQSIRKYKEKKLINNFNIYNIINTDKRRRVFSNLPINSGIDPNSLPKYTYYKPPYKYRGDCFVIENHPSQTKKVWSTTTSKKVSIQDKYTELINKINSYNINE